MKTTYIIVLVIQLCLVKDAFQFSILPRVVTRDVQKFVTTSRMTYEKDNNVIQNENIPNKNSKKRYIHPQVYKMFQRAQYLARNGENAVAKRLLVRCLELNPLDAHSWLALARLEANWGNIEKSRELFSQSMIKCPDNVHILQAFGHMEQKNGNDTLARNYLSQALKLDPYNAYVCHTLSSLELRNNNIDRVREILIPVYLHKPTSAVCTLLADLERQEGNIDKAKEVLLYGLKRCRSEKSKMLLSLAWLEEDAYNNPDEAYKLIELALKSDPANVRVHLAKANMELRLNKFNQAKNTLYAATKLVSDDGKHFTMLGTLELECGNYKEAQNVMLEGMKLYPGDFFLMQRLGTLEAKHGSIKKARDIFSKAITIHPHAPTFVAWAILEESQGNLALQPKLPQPLNIFPPSPSSNSGRSGSNNSKTVTKSQSSSSSAPLSQDNTTDPIDKYDTLISDGDHFEQIATAKARKNKNSDIEKDPAIDFSTMTSTAVFEYTNLQLTKARELFSLGMIVDNRHGPLYHAYGNMEMRHGNITAARRIFLQGIHINCTDLASIYHGWALLELKQNNIAEASQIFKKGIEVGLRRSHDIDQSVKFLFHSLGMLELDNYRPEEAERVFQSGIKIFPLHSHSLLGLALAEMKLGKTDLARQHFKDAVDADVYHAHAWQCWAIFEKQCGNLELASIIFKQGLKKNPIHAPLWHAFAVMEIQQGNLDAAKSLFAESIKRCPSHAQTYQAWACLEVRLGNLTRARELASQGLHRSPKHPALWTVTGLVEAKLGDNIRARETFNAAITRFPNHGALYKVLGELESRQGLYLEARGWFNIGIEKDPHYAPLYHEAALLEAKLGNIEGLSALHRVVKSKFQTYNGKSHVEHNNHDIIEKIRQLEINASSSNKSDKNIANSVEKDLFSNFPDPGGLESLDSSSYNEYTDPSGQSFSYNDY